ncbi:AraC family transcriptional regulator [Ferruginibacter paludis]|uniref:AraC family transcriptional regulator n=1 Tax=Ferruginibacter paludis TaxID=1310417 RepID=UPI0025B45DE6|nr:AraC family transcriptional regulator [Ferruginibacter paludis]MDN3657468.1 AraC family transcriptional regulator [Ferruginibacter paludis]
MTAHNQEHNDFRIAVPTDYEAVFSHFYFVGNKSGETITKTLLPSYQTIFIFNFGAKAFPHSKQNTQIAISKCLVLGPIKQAFDYSLPANAEILVANLKDDAFYRFFGNASIAEHVPVNPDERVHENCFTVLWGELNQIPGINDRVSHILKFCEPYLRHRNAIAEQLTNFKEQTVNSIKSIASENNQTERNIQLNHKKHFGYSAKELNRYQRFKRHKTYTKYCSTCCKNGLV